MLRAAPFCWCPVPLRSGCAVRSVNATGPQYDASALAKAKN